MKHILLLTLVLFTHTFFGQGNNSCANASSFCSGSPTQYAAGVGAGQAQPGTTYGCLGSQPNPAWFIIPVTQSGSLSVHISAAHDVDFVAWGPFLPGDPAMCSSLNGHMVPNSGGNTGCSFSGSITETLTIANAMAGEVYVLLVTNYWGQAQTINVAQLGTSSGYGNFNVVGTNTLCAGGTATANVIPTANIQGVQWFGPNGLISTSFAQSFPNMTATTLYTVVGIGAANQSCSTTKLITVVPTPTPVAINNGPICVGQAANFNVIGATTYAWSGPSNFSGSGSSTAVNNAQLNNSGTYSVIGTVGTCTGQATTYLNVKPNPTVTVGSTGNYCYGKSFSLLSGGATTYTWSGPNSFNYQGQNPIFFNNAINMSGNYSVTGEINGCVSTTGTLVTIHPSPGVTAVSSGSVCQNSSLTLVAGGALTYTWAGPASFASMNPTVAVNSGQPGMTGIYQVTGKDIYGCINTATVHQAVRAAPYINIYSSNACVNKNLTLTASGGDTYLWSGPDNYTSTNPNPTIPNVDFVNSGVYNVTVTTSYGCANTASVETVVYNNPNISFSGATEICKGQTFAFTAGGAINYKWLNSVGIITESPTFTISSLSRDLQATYTLVGTDGHFCSNNVMFYPVVNALPAARIIPDKENSCTPFCSSITLDLLSSNITNQKWTTSDGDKTATSASTVFTKCFGTAGIYTINVNLTDAKGCTSVVTRTIEAFPSPKADFITSPEKPTENDNNVTFIDNSKNSEGSTFTWNFYDGEKGSKRDTSYQESPTRTFTSTGSYFVYMKVASANGCSDSVAKIIVVGDDPTFFVPNAFTPNGDNINDLFMPKSIGLKNYQMQIFSRWGQLLFSTNDPAAGWNGRTNGGDIAPSGSYIYKFTLSGMDREPRVLSGQFSLIK